MLYYCVLRVYTEGIIQIIGVYSYWIFNEGKKLYSTVYETSFWI